MKSVFVRWQDYQGDWMQFREFVSSLELYPHETVLEIGIQPNKLGWAYLFEVIPLLNKFRQVNIGINFVENDFPLEHIKSLKNLGSIWAFGGSALHGIQDLNGVQRFHLQAAQAISVQPVAQIESLVECILEGKVTVLDSLSMSNSIKKLKFIRVESKTIGDACFGVGLYWLEFVSIKSNYIPKSLNPKIRVLALRNIVDACNLDFIHSFPNLEYLWLTGMKKIITLDSVSFLKKLKGLYIDQLVNLVDISSLQYVGGLEELCISGADKLTPQAFSELSRHSALKRGTIEFSSSSKNSMIDKILFLDKPALEQDLEINRSLYSKQ